MYYYISIFVYLFIQSWMVSSLNVIEKCTKMKCTNKICCSVNSQYLIKSVKTYHLNFRANYIYSFGVSNFTTLVTVFENRSKKSHLTMWVKRATFTFWAVKIKVAFVSKVRWLPNSKLWRLSGVWYVLVSKASEIEGLAVW